jgi:hydroxymethylglutaryl-CoA synthase
VAQEPGVHGRLQDPPIFNGKYSTNCYIDQTLKSLDHMFTRRRGPRAAYLRALTAVFMHRPYHRMPANAWALAYLAALAADGGAEHEELLSYCSKAQVDLDVVVRELLQPPGATELAQRNDLAAEVYPLSMLVLKAFRESPVYGEMVDGKMSLGSPQMMEMGNLYTAALPAWLAGAFDVAVREGRALDNANVLVAGYGSGDAAEAIPARVVEGWEDAARRIRFREDLEGAIPLNQMQYQALHAGQVPEDLPKAPPVAFSVDRIGEAVDRHFQDFGIEYYRYAGGVSG